MICSRYAKTCKTTIWSFKGLFPKISLEVPFCGFLSAFKMVGITRPCSETVPLRLDWLVPEEGRQQTAAEAVQSSCSRRPVNITVKAAWPPESPLLRLLAFYWSTAEGVREGNRDRREEWRREREGSGRRRDSRVCWTLGRPHCCCVAVKPSFAADTFSNTPSPNSAKPRPLSTAGSLLFL